MINFIKFILIAAFFGPTLAASPVLNRRVAVTSIDKGVHLSYESSQEDSVYFHVGTIIYPAYNAMGIYGKVGYSFKIAPDRSLSVYAIGCSLHQEERAVSTGLGIKTTRKIYDFMSVGAEAHARLAWQIQQVGLLETSTSLTFHVGAERNIDLEIKPAHVRLFGAQRSSRSCIGASIGYRF